MNITIIKKIKNNQAPLIALLEIFVGVILLIQEIRDFISLPTTTEVDEKWGGIVDLFKYKENTYCLLYLWVLLLFTGGNYWINRKLHWIFNQILLITLLFATLLTPESILPLFFSQFIFTSFFVVLLFGWLEIKMHRESHLETIGVGSRTKWISVFLGIISSTIYILLCWMTI